MRLLVVEDQKKMAGFIRQGLTEVGYVVDVAENGSTAESLAAENPYDLIILWTSCFPDQSGLDTARHLRQDGYSGPILMLTALAGTKDKVHGLDAGADDYLTKPFAFDELAARVRALLRRQGSAQGSQSVLTFVDLEMNLVSRKITRSGKELNLTPKEFSLLSYFLRNPNRPISRTTISEHVWDIRFDSDSNVIDVYINMLRKKVDQPFEKKLIHTVVGVGWRPSRRLARKYKDSSHRSVSAFVSSAFSSRFSASDFSWFSARFFTKSSSKISKGNLMTRFLITPSISLTRSTSISSVN